MRRGKGAVCGDLMRCNGLWGSTRTPILCIQNFCKTKTLKVCNESTGRESKATNLSEYSRKTVAFLTYFDN